MIVGGDPSPGWNVSASPFQSASHTSPTTRSLRRDPRTLQRSAFQSGSEPDDRRNDAEREHELDEEDEEEGRCDEQQPGCEAQQPGQGHDEGDQENCGDDVRQCAREVAGEECERGTRVCEDQKGTLVMMAL